MSRLRPLLESLAAVALGLGVGACITLAAGESPLRVLSVLAHSSLGSWYGLGMTLFYATPLIFTGLAVAIPYHLGLFNIGAEGQLTMGALATAAVGVWLGQSGWGGAPLFLLSALAGFAAGAFWGFVPGWLRVRRGSHEVINTIMLNFVAAAASSWVVIELIRDNSSPNAESIKLPDSALLPHFAGFDGSPVGWALIIAIAVALVMELVLYRTVAGFEMRAIGQSEEAAAFGGIHVPRRRIAAMALAGGIAGLVGVAEVLGHSGRFKMGFSPDYGFIGIAVALLARGRPTGVILSALLFGALHKGAADLDLETEAVTRDLSLVLQACVILAATSDGLWDRVRAAARAKPRKGDAA